MFKQNFVRLCNMNKKSPSSVCVEIGITPAAYTQWSDSTVPRRATLQKIADYFGVTVEFLLQDGNETSPAVTVPFSSEETTLIESYRNSPENVRKAVKALLNFGD